MKLQYNKDDIIKLAQSFEHDSNIEKIKDLAQAQGLSEGYFIKVFKSVLGVTPKQYIKVLKMEKMKKLLPKQTVTAAMYEAGFNSSTEYYNYAQSALGMKAKNFKNGAQNETIYVALGECVLGQLLVAQTQKGICAIYLGEDEHQLLIDLHHHFPKANFVLNNPQFNETISQVVGLIENPLKQLDLPLDLHGTNFQIQVWQTLKNIPLGQTKTYSEIAQDMKMPNATRAVARACATNHVSLLIPCHRVIGKSGDLCGYRWGIEKKKLLLEQEKSAILKK